MKPRKEISQQKSDKVHLTFCDVAACFSQEEWKLLHHWQKELYKNIMKEIHQAMISLELTPDSKFSFGSKSSLKMSYIRESKVLGYVHIAYAEQAVIDHRGPQIAASVFSLRPNENDDLCFMDLQGYEIKGTIYPSSKDTLSDPDALFRGKQYPKDTPETEESDTCNHPSTGSKILSSNLLIRGEEELAAGLMNPYEAVEADDNTSTNFGYVDVAPTDSSDIKREGELYSIDPLNCDGSEGLTNTTRFAFHNTDEDATIHDYRRTETEGSHIGFNSVGINEEGETYPIDVQDNQRRKRFYNPTAGNGRMKRKKTLGSSLTCKNRSALQKSLATNSNPIVIQNLHEIENSESEIWSGSDPDPAKVENVQWQSACSEVRNSESVQIAPYIQIPEEYNKCEQTVKNDIIPDDTNPTQSCGPYICSESLQSRQKKKDIVHSQQHKVKGRYICVVCSKNFSAKSKLVKHEMIHTGERPYRCTICGKSFNQKGVLHRHQKVHTGERPYQCKVCGKNFTLKHNLLAHQIIHTGDRPYQCHICVKSFNRKDHLLQHQRIHAKEQHFQT